VNGVSPAIAIVSDLRPGATALAILGLVSGIAALVFFSASWRFKLATAVAAAIRGRRDRRCAVSAAARHVGARSPRQKPIPATSSPSALVPAARRRLLRQSGAGQRIDADADGRAAAR